METVDERTLEEKFESFKFEVKKKFDNGVKFCKEHKEVVFVMAPVLVESGTRILLTILRTIGKHEERISKERTIYDRKHGHYIRLKRSLKPKEWDELDFRKDNGENLVEILKDMGLR